MQGVLPQQGCIPGFVPLESAKILLQQESFLDSGKKIWGS